MTKTILEECYQAYSEQLITNANLAIVNNELVQKMHILERQLEIATEVLKEYTKVETDDWIDSKEVATKALKEMEGVK